MAEEKLIKFRDEIFLYTINTSLQSVSEMLYPDSRQIRCNVCSFLTDTTVSLSSDMVPETKSPKERICTHAMGNLLRKAGTEMPYRTGAALLTDALSSGYIVNYKTLEELMERDGKAVADTVKTRSEQILEEHAFDYKTASFVKEEEHRHQSRTCTESQKNTGIIPPADKCPKEPVDLCSLEPLLENPEKTVYIYFDDVLVKRQISDRRASKENEKLPKLSKEERKNRRTTAGEKAYVNITDVVIECETLKIQFPFENLQDAFKTTLAVLFEKDLLYERDLVFLVDGAKDLREEIERVFAFHPHRVILDWFHMKKKLTEMLSMSFKARKKDEEDFREAVERTLFGFLWRGETEKAIDYLENTLDPSCLRENNRINEAKEYILKHTERIQKLQAA